MTSINNFLSRAALMLLLLAGYSVSAVAQNTVQLGTGSSTSSYFPIYTCYGYNYSQQIYTAAELNAQGASGVSTISKIRFKQTNTTAATNWLSWTVYMGNTANASFASSTSWIPTASLTQVYTGTITPVTGGGWMELTLATPFSWDGTSNIVIAVDENTPSYNCTAAWASYTSTPASGARSLLYYSDATNPDPNTPPAANRSTDNNIAQIQFSMTLPGCSGTPTPGTAAASVSAACAGNPITLALTGATTGGGITYQWQSSPAGANSWTNISGATSSTYSVTQSAATDYRAIVTCTLSNKSDNSNTVSVSQNNFLACYCASGATNTGDEEIYSVTLNGVNSNTFSGQGNGCTTVAPGPGSVLSMYSNFKSVGTFANLAQAATSTFIIEENECDGSTYYGNGAAIWIDYNHDGVFDNATEKVYVENSTTISPRNISSSFVVPTTALTGITGMRVTVSEGNSGSSLTSCLSYGYGETEDYLVNITPAVACAGMPTPGNTVSTVDTAISGTPFTLSLQNTPSTTGNSVQWYSSTDNVTFTAISGATNNSYSATQIGNAPSYYYAAVTCANSGLTANSATKTVYTKIVYCVPTISTGCNDGDVIARIKLNTLDNNSGTGCPSGVGGNGYSNYYDSTAYTTTLFPARTYGVKVWAGQYTANYAAWIDYNNDGIFDNVTERIGYTTTPVPGSGTVGVLGDSATFTITLSCTPPSGVHRMRIREQYSTTGSAITPCGSASYGEVEDYKITIGAQAACAPGGALAVTGTGSTTISVAFPINCATASRFDFNYGVAPFAQNGAGGAFKNNQLVTYNATNDTAFYTITGVNPLTTYDVYYRARCSSSPSSLSVWSSIAATGTTLAPPCAGTPNADTISGPSGACSGTSFTLTSVGQGTEIGYTYQWEVSTNNGATFTAISGATSATSASVSQTVASVYRQVTTCTNSSLTAASNTVSVGMNASLVCYCAAANNSSTGLVNAINEVSVRGKIVSTAATQPTADPNYTLNTTDTFSTRRGVFVPVTVKVAAGSTITSVWIDYNNNGVYDSYEHDSVSYNAAAGSLNTALYFVPDTAYVGLVGMRVRSRVVGSPNGPTDACTTFGSGETEDYLIKITADTCKLAAKLPGTIYADTTLKVCGNEMRTYNVLFGTDADYYQWTAPANASIVGGQGSNRVQVMYTTGFAAPGDTLRVIAKNECGTSAQKKLFVAYRGLPKTPGTIYADTTLAICPGETRVYRTASIDPLATSFQWTLPTGASFVGSSNNDTITVLYGAGFTAGDTLSLTATNGCGTSLAKNYIAKFRGAPKTPGTVTVDNALKPCPGETRVYTIAPVAFANTYTWTAPAGATITAGQGTTSATVSYGAGFTMTDTLRTVATNTCGTSAQKKTTTTWRGLPAAPSAVLGNLYGVCSSTSQAYSVTPIAGVNTYNWSVINGGGTITSGQGTTNINVSFGAVVADTIAVGTSNGCGNSLLKKKIIVKGAPNKAVVTGPACANPNQTVSYNANTYGATYIFWDGPTGSTVNLVGSTTNIKDTLTVLAGTAVNVKFGASVAAIKATAKNACGAASYTTYTVGSCIRMGMEEEGNSITVDLMPNPATEQVAIRVNSTEDGEADVRIMSITGQLLINDMMPSTQHGQLVLPISDLAPGMYMVEVTVNGQKIVKQLIKN